MQNSLIVVVWNGLPFLFSCLRSLQQQLTSDDEILVIDNGSTDGSAEFVAECFPDVRLARLPGNLGYAGGVNYGLHLARGDRFFIFNQDLELCTDWLSYMSSALQEPSVGIVGCKILYPDGRLQHAGGSIGWPQALPDHYGHLQEDDGRWDQIREVDYVTGAAWGFSASLVHQIGGLDASFWPGYFEEVDFCFRASDAGFRVCYIPEAVAIHVESTTLRQGSEQYLRAFHGNRLRFVMKRLPPQQFLNEFVPVELVWLERNLGLREQCVMASVYKMSMLTAASIYAGRSDLDIVWKDVACIVRNLYALWERSRILTR